MAKKRYVLGEGYFAIPAPTGDDLVGVASAPSGGFLHSLYFPFHLRGVRTEYGRLIWEPISKKEGRKK